VDLRLSTDGGYRLIILFGGNAFIGRHIAAVAQGRQPVTVVARRQDEAFHREFAPGAGFMHLEDFASEPGEELIRSARALVYLAATSLPATHMATPWLEVSENVTPALTQFVRAGSLNPQLRIVLPSSGGTVYGEGHSRPIPESAPVAPVSPYGLGKVMIEQALAFAARRTGCDHAILRISNPVGRWHGTRGQGLIELAVRRSVAGEPLTIFGDGGAVRDYFDADDLAEAMLAVCTASGRLGEVCNVGSGQGRSTLEACELVGEATGRPLELEFRPGRESDLGYAVLDAAKIEARFGWKASTPLPQTVAKLVEVMKDRRGSMGL
jgi:UDP-glucose 4-epimerase